MVIEWLTFRVKPELREKFIKKDEAIWTATLSQQDGFINKEVWIAPDREDRVFFVIRWQTREQWKAIPMKLLAETDKQFASAVGKNNYKMLESKEYHIRKFPN